MFYDTFSNDYDRFVNWPGRLAAELPFLEARLKQAGARRVLDAACGTGMHAIALAQHGFEIAGADYSAGMIERARLNAAAVGTAVRFEQAGFGELAPTLGRGTFDAVLCLGNSLPHLLTTELLAAALTDFAALLKPGGMLLLQNRNFDAVMQIRERWMEPQAARDGETEWLFVRFYDFDPDGLITFHILTLRREGAGAWTQAERATRLRPLLRDELTTALVESGFGNVVCYGDMSGAPFEAERYGNLVVVAGLEGK